MLVIQNESLLTLILLYIRRVIIMHQHNCSVAWKLADANQNDVGTMNSLTFILTTRGCNSDLAVRYAVFHDTYSQTAWCWLIFMSNEFYQT